MDTSGNADDGERPERKRPGRRPLVEGSAEDTRQEIRRHAMRLFREQGYAAVSMDDIAQAAGLTRATLYYHYKSKAEIFTQSALLLLGYARYGTEQIVGLSHLSVQARLRLLVTGRREAEGPPEAEGEDVTEAMVAETLPHLSPAQQAQVRAAMDALRHLVRALLAEGTANGELQLLPSDILEYLFWQIFQPSAYPAHWARAQEEKETHLLDAFLRAILQT